MGDMSVSLMVSFGLGWWWRDGGKAYFTSQLELGRIRAHPGAEGPPRRMARDR